MSDAPADADVVDFYVRASAGFGQQIQAIGGEEWDLHTPCADWDIRTVVAHVVLGDAQIPDLVEGNVVAAAEVDVSILGREPLAVWRGTALRAIEVVQSTPLDTVVHHPLGSMPFLNAVGFRITDSLVHAWDLATARSADLALPPDIAAWCLDFWLPLADQLEGSAHFAPMLEPADDSAGARLLALLGRSG